ncbi:AraC family transcriptional regulator [Ulvibacter sp. MAR_2010_11]|uniref:nickel-binding protein n=1 Tax=Ulvibacter sp. MAR_2010_11 TaxID=1250229 RepID=UPI000C2C3D76|nr:nickel-binding protein [Ulvibacter sp. MAR_2010_11]PKA84164.1 AraC family transcriptional regulator [Ulvibacter sp. MAR_2010_11]
MPIYMDRHDIPEEITAEHVAQMHREDLKIEHLYGCKGMTYWCDEKRRTAFCLINAPNKKALQEMHNHAHGTVPHQIIEVDSAIVESFLGRIEDPVKSLKTELNIINDPAFRTILILGFQKTTLREAVAKQLNTDIKKYNGAIVDCIKKHTGRIVKQKPDYFLTSFNSVTNAVICALALQQLSITHSAHLKTNIGLHVGIPVTEKEGLFEDTIKLAAHFTNIEKGKVVISSEVKELYESENLNIAIDKKLVFALTPSEEKFLTTLMEYTEKEWANPSFNAGSFGKKLGYSKSQLYRKMISVTGMSPNSFIKAYRLQKALELLHKKEDNISEIAFNTGFNSAAYFSKCFMDTYGILPSKYSRQH